MNAALSQIWRRRLESAAEEMGEALKRSAFSANIKERRDYSCALFDAAGVMIAQAAHIPVHLGAMPLSTRAAMSAADRLGGLAPGDQILLNDPFAGGAHLPDMTLVAPVFLGDAAPAFYVASRAHHADVGGVSAGSMPLSKSVFEEGIRIPPVKLVRAGELDEGLLRLIAANSRAPIDREGDFAAQIAAGALGVRRLTGLAARFGRETLEEWSRVLLDRAEAAARTAIGAFPDGVYEAEEVMEGLDRPLRIAVRLEVKGEALLVDLRNAAPQDASPLNAVRAVTLSTTLYVLRCLVEAAGIDAPANEGLSRPLTVLTTPGTVLDAAFPAAVAAGNVETSQRLVDLLFAALANAANSAGPAATFAIPAASQGTMNNLCLGGIGRDGAPFAHYETIGGGGGASADGPGASGLQCHMTNTLNTPVEALEFAFPLRVRQSRLRAGAGGVGRHRGGNGVVREIEALAPLEATLLAERRESGPWGLCGGRSGKPGRDGVVHNGVETPIPGKTSLRLAPGDRIVVRTPGGGGFGKPISDDQP